MTGLEVALTAGPADALRRLIGACPAPGPGLGAWRWAVRRQLAPLRVAVAHPGPAGDDLAARHGGCLRGQQVLVGRMSAMLARVLDDADLQRLRRDLLLLLDDVRRHEQRCHDLAYDEVSMELGGSE